MPTAEQKIATAFDNIYDHLSWFSLIVGQWENGHVEEFDKLSEMFGADTCATDGPNLYFNRKFIEDLSQKDVNTLIEHEAGHVWLGHHFRLFEAGTDSSKWEVTPAKNIAADLALNWYIRDDFDPSGKLRKIICMPGDPKRVDGGLDFSVLPTGKDAEFYYQKMPANLKKTMQEMMQEAMKSLEEMLKDAANGKGSSIGGIMPHPSMKPGKDGKMPSAKEQKAAKEKWERQVIGGMMNAEGCGHDPGNFKETAEALKPKKSEIPWESYLRRFLTKHVQIRYSYDKPNRRSAWRNDLRQPARHSRNVTEGLFLVDTSGSMYVEEMNRALRESEKILVAYPGSKVTLRQADTQLQKTEQIFTKWDFPMVVPPTWSGRGGTELAQPIIEAAKAKKFSWMVVVSDMIWDYRNAKDPGIPVFWLQTKGLHKDVPFGFPIECKE